MKNNKILVTLSASAVVSLFSGCPGDECSYWKDEACTNYIGYGNDRELGEICEGDYFFGYGGYRTKSDDLKISKSAPDSGKNHCRSGLMCVDSICKTSCSNDSQCLNGNRCVIVYDVNEYSGPYGYCVANDSDVCGNGILDVGEACDDGNKKAGDGCSAKCKVEAGWECAAGADGKSICSVKECHSEEECNGDGDSDGDTDGNSSVIDRGDGESESGSSEVDTDDSKTEVIHSDDEADHNDADSDPGSSSDNDGFSDANSDDGLDDEADNNGDNE